MFDTFITVARDFVRFFAKPRVYKLFQLCCFRIYYFWSFIPLVKKYFNIKVIAYLILLLAILTIFVCLAVFAEYESIGMIKGEPGNYEVTFDFIEPNNYLSDKKLILVMNYDKNYYLVEKRSSIPKDYSAPVHVIPDYAIKSATIRRIY